MGIMKRLSEYLVARCPDAVGLSNAELLACDIDPDTVKMDFIRNEGLNWTYYCQCCEEEHVVEMSPDKDYIYLGEVPSEEECKYATRLSCKALMVQLRNQFCNEPEGARLFLQPEGDGYYTLCCEYDNRFPLSHAYAFMLEGEYPEKWTTSGLKELNHLKEIY